MRYGLSLLLYYAFIDAKYHDAVVCNPSNASCPRGFRCPNDPLGVFCFGATGYQVLDTFHVNYETIEADLDIGAAVGKLVALVAFFKLMQAC